MPARSTVKSEHAVEPEFEPEENPIITRLQAVGDVACQMSHAGLMQRSMPLIRDMAAVVERGCEIERLQFIIKRLQQAQIWRHSEIGKLVLSCPELVDVTITSS